MSDKWKCPCWSCQLTECREICCKANDWRDRAEEALRKTEKYKWHDLRKNPDDLPPVGHDVLVCVSNKTGKTYNRTWLLDSSTWRHATSKKQRSYVKGSVIAWKEIEPFEEEQP